jgi:hypothetical protein
MVKKDRKKEEKGKQTNKKTKQNTHTHTHPHTYKQQRQIGLQTDVVWHRCGMSTFSYGMIVQFKTSIAPYVQ